MDNIHWIYGHGYGYSDMWIWIVLMDNVLKWPSVNNVIPPSLGAGQGRSPPILG